MAVAKKIRAYLKENGIRYQHLRHAVAYTAQEIAAAQHVPGKQVVKCVILKADGEYVMAVLPAIHLVDFGKLKKLAKCKAIELATEEEMQKLFPDYELGAMPPFGRMHELPVYADEILREDEEIVFNAGSHTDTIKMRYDDYENLARPVVGDFGKHI